MLGSKNQYMVGFLTGVCLTSLVWLGSNWWLQPQQQSDPHWPDAKRSDSFLSARELETLPSEEVSTDMKGLQIDVYGLPAAFLDSTEQVNSLIEAAIGKMSKIKVLQKMTYHFQPQGLTSLWLLSASHASIHTWPEQGFAAIDFLTCGSSDLVMIAEMLEQAFSEVSEDAIFQFSLTERGQGVERQPVNDQAVQLVSMQQEKHAHYRGRSKFQAIEVWDVMGNSWVDGAHANLDRRMYLDGVLQLSTEDEAMYHEMLIHPAMLTHRGPERVVIMGGGDGGALHNVAMHRSVQSVRLIEIDAQVIEVSKDAFPSFTSSFSDPRAEVVIADAFSWIAAESQSHPGSVDALFFDLLDINVPSPLLDMLFADGKLGKFAAQVHQVLRGDGFAVFQLGEKRLEAGACSSVGGSDDECRGTLRQHAFVEELQKQFKDVLVYSQYVPSFLGHWLFAVASDDAGFTQKLQQHAAAEVARTVEERLSQHERLGFFTDNVLQKLRFETDIDQPTVIQRFEPSVDVPEPEKCPGLVMARANSEYPGYVIPYMLANSRHGIGLGVYTMRPIRRGEAIWRFHDESFREVKPENWRSLVESHPYTREHGIKAFLEKDWINEYVVPPEGGHGVTTKLFMQLDDARFTNHGYTPDHQREYLQVADSKGGSEAPQEYTYGRVLLATRDIEACEELLEDYQSSMFDLEEDAKEQDVEWWSRIMESYGLDNSLDLTPGSSAFPEWALRSGPSNTD